MADENNKTKKVQQLSQFMKEKLNLELLLPDFNVPSFAKITLTACLEVLDKIYEEKTKELGAIKFRLCGSSMGGLVGARYAELHPERVSRLLLLCPGFDMVKVWSETINLPEWRTRGEWRFTTNDGVTTKVHYKLIEDIQSHPSYPKVSCPVRILHAGRDQVVPIDVSKKFIESHPKCDLVIVDDDHPLLNSFDAIEKQLQEFLVGK